LHPYRNFPPLPRSTVVQQLAIRLIIALTFPVHHLRNAFDDLAYGGDLEKIALSINF